MYERFFEEVGEAVDGDDGGPPAFEDQPDARTITEAAAEHGIEIPPPIATQWGRPTNTTKGEKGDKRNGRERLVPLQECHLHTTPGRSTNVFE